MKKWLPKMKYLLIVLCTQWQKKYSTSEMTFPEQCKQYDWSPNPILCSLLGTANLLWRSKKIFSWFSSRISQPFLNNMILNIWMIINNFKLLKVREMLIYHSFCHCFQWRRGKQTINDQRSKTVTKNRKCSSLASTCWPSWGIMLDSKILNNHPKI